MTTPERLRRRQIRNDWFIAILACALVLGWFYFRHQDQKQEECVNRFFAAQADVFAARADAAERESEATRNFLKRATAVETREEFLAAREEYVQALRGVDRQRRNNPPKPFPKELCG